jgi:hypothetical protein
LQPVHPAGVFGSSHAWPPPLLEPEDEPEVPPDEEPELLPEEPPLDEPLDDPLEEPLDEPLEEPLEEPLDDPPDEPLTPPLPDPDSLAASPVEASPSPPRMLVAPPQWAVSATSTIRPGGPGHHERVRIASSS